MEVGDYVRTDDGLIGKVISEPYEYKDSIVCDIDFGNNDIYNEYEMYQSIVKSSPNIIDLIEVGDYVNGKNVIKVWEEPFGEFAGQIFTILEGEETAPTIREIKSLLTKEQFESMEYKLEENK